MKKHQKKQRKLRKCELGIKIKNTNKGHRYLMTNLGLLPIRDDKKPDYEEDKFDISLLDAIQGKFEVIAKEVRAFLKKKL